MHQHWLSSPRFDDANILVERIPVVGTFRPSAPPGHLLARLSDAEPMSTNRWTATSLITIVSALSVSLCVAVFERAIAEEIDSGPPPALTSGQAPPLPKAGALAQPRSQHQIGLPAELTKSVIPPGSPLTPAVARPSQNWVLL
jgi:hypothetical protein